MLIDPRTYSVCIFDCDGVLLDSNDMKTNAVKEVLSKNLSSQDVKGALKHHKENPYMPGYDKFNYYLIDKEDRREVVKQTLDHYSRLVIEGFKNCHIIPGVQKFLSAIPGSCYNYVVSGGREDEVREALVDRDLASYFQGIYGNPKGKLEIITEILAELKHKGPGLYFGDSRHDFEVAKEFDMDFVFVYGYTLEEGWAEFLQNSPGVAIIYDFNSIGR